MNEFFRIKSKNYATIANEFLKDGNLSNKAKGVLAMILALPDDWEFSVKGMVKITKDGEASLRAAIKEMREQGYCYFEPVRINNKIARWKYYFSGEKLTKELLCDFLNVENLNVENRAQYNNINNNNIINPNNSLNNKNKENNILSANENFDEFYKLYPLKKSKQSALKAWNKLSDKDKQAAKEKLLAYIDDCMRNKRSFKYPATYLNQRTWEDDFGTAQKVAFYDALETDSEEKKRFKAWMRKTHPEIENTALPLSYEDYMQFYEEYGTCAIDAALAYIEKDIYMYRKADIAQVLKSVLTEEE